MCCLGFKALSVIPFTLSTALGWSKFASGKNYNQTSHSAIHKLCRGSVLSSFRVQNWHNNLIIGKSPTSITEGVCGGLYASPRRVSVGGSRSAVSSSENSFKRAKFVAFQLSGPLPKSFSTRAGLRWGCRVGFLWSSATTERETKMEIRLLEAF